MMPSLSNQNFMLFKKSYAVVLKLARGYLNNLDSKDATLV